MSDASKLTKDGRYHTQVANLINAQEAFAKASEALAEAKKIARNHGFDPELLLDVHLDKAPDFVAYLRKDLARYENAMKFRKTMEQADANR